MTDAPLSFGAWRGKWLDQIFADPEMTGDACRVLYALTGSLNKRTRIGLPGNVALAEKAYVNLRTVQRAIALASSRGHLVVGEPVGKTPRTLAPALKEEGVLKCRPSVPIRGDTTGDMRGDSVFEVSPQNQQGGGGTLRTLKTSQYRESACGAPASKNC